MAALQYLESLRNDHPELGEWYNALADLYQKKLWHQLTLKLEQFVAHAVFQVTTSIFFNFSFLDLEAVVEFYVQFSVRVFNWAFGFFKFLNYNYNLCEF